MNIKQGDKLRNGATVVKTSQDDNVVLANWDGEYVTWCVDSDGNAYWGHYFQGDYAKADHDFYHRSTK